jgi:putative phosphoribosyl transferase
MMHIGKTGFDVRPFPDRRAAGIALAQMLRDLSLPPPLTVLALPRGGVPVAHEVAGALNAPLDVMVVRKIGMPGHQELAIGAIARDVVVREPGAIAQVGTLGAHFEQFAQAERKELERRERKYRAGAAPLDLRGQTVVLVDDGLATGCTMLAAVRAAQNAGAARVVAAAPIAAPEAAALVDAEADMVIILGIPGNLMAVGDWYGDFGQVSDAEVCALLAGRRVRTPAGRSIPASGRS